MAEREYDPWPIAAQIKYDAARKREDDMRDEAARVAISVLQAEIEVLNCELDRAYDYTVRLENQIKDAMNTLAGR